MTDFKTAAERYREVLDPLPIHSLRIVGREVGVRTPSARSKSDLTEAIIGVLAGNIAPVGKSNRGAPIKEEYLDPSILQRLYAIREDAEQENVLEVHGEREGNLYEKPVYSGILEITQGGYGFLRAKNCQPSADGDVFVPAPVIHNFRLREGDFIACTAKERQKNDSSAIEDILSVNGLALGKYEARRSFDALTAVYPAERISLSEGNGSLALRMLDLFAPIGKGQRALIIAPPKAGKTTLLKEIARSISEFHKEILLIVLLIDERPEEVTDFCTSVPDAQVVYSTFDEGADHHIRAAELVLAHAKRMTEAGRDVVVLLDSVTKLTRAYNVRAENSGKTLSGGLEASALAEPKRFFGAARNTREGGSLTILATALVETGSRMDDVIYEEFKGTGNSDVFLSRELAERRIFPAIDLRRSGTRKEELLLSGEELSAVYRMRERGLTDHTEGVIDMMKKTSDNGEFISRLNEWLKVYKS